MRFKLFAQQRQDQLMPIMLRDVFRIESLTDYKAHL
jgi:hypothetical protein